MLCTVPDENGFTKTPAGGFLETALSGSALHIGGSVLCVNPVLPVISCQCTVLAQTFISMLAQNLICADSGGV